MKQTKFHYQVCYPFSIIPLNFEKGPNGLSCLKQTLHNKLLEAKAIFPSLNMNTLRFDDNKDIPARISTKNNAKRQKPMQVILALNTPTLVDCREESIVTFLDKVRVLHNQGVDCNVDQ